jgi:hypothetical protein
MSNPMLDQITGNAVLLKDRYTAVTECMSRPDEKRKKIAEGSARL